MKKLFLLTAACGFFVQANAQTPQKVGISLIHKISATWCGPCGSWGWDLANKLIADNAGKALYMGAFPDPSTSWGTNKFYSAAGRAFYDYVESGGFPDFGNNMINLSAPNTTSSGISTTGISRDINAAVSDFAAKEPLASPANIMTISGTDISVDAKVEFWSAATGDFYLAAYMIEDKAQNAQNGQTASSGSTAHHDVLRGSMTTSSWGESIASGAIAAGATYTKKFTFKVTDTKWDLANFKIYTVLWKKDGTKYEYINVAQNEVGSTSVAAISGVSSLQLFPNPAAKAPVTLAMNVQKEIAFDLNVTDITGRSVYTVKGLKAQAGNNSFSVPVAQLQPGVYMVHIAAEGGAMNQQLTITQ